VSCGCGISNVEFKNSLRIVGGEEAIPYSWPMIVSLRQNYWPFTKHYCAGSILNKYFILTAAHCAVNKYGGALSILSASAIHNRSDLDAMVRPVERIFIHPNYIGHEDGFKNDIALLQLGIPLDIDENPYHAQTCLPQINTSINANEYPSNGTRLVAIGWGARANDRSGMTDMIQQTEILTIDNNDPICNRSFIDSEKQFCAGLHQGGKGLFCFYN
jgi:secreted trypsin-like serine protease